MKALRIHKFGGPDEVQWEEIPEPPLKPGHVKIRVRAGGLNRLDVWVREGIPGIPVALPLIQGCDVAGEVLEWGEGVKGFKRGARVLLQPGYGCGHCRFCQRKDIHFCKDYGIFGETCDGNFSQIAVLPAQNLFPVPDNLGWTEAAAIPLVSLTAWEMLVRKAALEKGETLLVLGASSGVGSMAIQIGKFWGARVLAVTSGEASCQRARELGADEVIDRQRTPEFSREVKRLTDGALADVVFEHTGEATLSQSFRSLGRGGRLVTCGGTTGPRMEIDVRHLFSKQWSVLGSTMGPSDSLLTILPHFASGALRPVVGMVMPMREGAEAQKRLVENRVFGKIVLLEDES
ncbi:MAG: zinc-binding dehydrogenase [Planctomycetota bacterium]